MNHTAQALLAIRLLQSLPNWDRVATVYGDIDDHLNDLAQDLEGNDWGELIKVGLIRSSWKRPQPEHRAPATRGLFCVGLQQARPQCRNGGCYH